MVDVHSPEQRSYNMSRIKGRDTKPELILKRKLKKFIYQPNEYGKPDFINYKKKTVIFVDGCFWHGCPKHFIKPRSNVKFWENKIKRNTLRDREVTLNYKSSGWGVIRIWTHELKFLNAERFKIL